MDNNILSSKSMETSTPVVSFVIPCYNLGHLLSECVNSILSQTYQDFEILILDDCSPDQTEQVARTFADPRVRYIRNEENLGHLRNYNKGIQLSRSKYVWLISADDYLRREYILERYLQLMEKNPKIGYSFCPAVGVRDRRETSVIKYSVYSERDCVVNGATFLEQLIKQNIVIAASALVRRECYETISLFPLDAEWASAPVEMGWVGDWYLWCVFALSFDVAYFAEPMVAYREHDLNMTAIITDPDKVEKCAAADIAIPWMIKRKADQSGMSTLSEKCLLAVANEYARQASSKGYRSSEFSLTVERFERSLCASTSSESERGLIRSHFLDGRGDRLLREGQLLGALSCYWTCVRQNPRMVRTFGKLALLPIGRYGCVLRQYTRSIRRRMSGEDVVVQN